MIHGARPVTPEQLLPSRGAFEVTLLSPPPGLRPSSRTSPRVTKWKKWNTPRFDPGQGNRCDPVAEGETPDPTHAYAHTHARDFRLQIPISGLWQPTPIR